MLRPWLQAIANDGRPDDTATYMEQIARHTTMGMSLVTMGFSMPTAFLQLFGLTSTLAELGPKWLVSGLKGALTPAQRTFALEQSNELRHVMHTWDRDARSAYNQTLAMISGSVVEQAKYRHAQMTNFAFYTMGLCQQQVNIATWIAAFNKASAEGRTDATVYADAVVRKTQSGGGAKDLAKVQRHGDFRKMFTSFYSYFSTLYGQLRAAGQRMSSEPLIAMAQMASLVLLPSLIEKLMRDGTPGDDEPWDEWVKDYMKGGASYAIATLPMLRDFVQPFLSKYSFAMSPGAQVLDKFTAAIKHTVTGDSEMTASQIKAAAKGLGLLLHLPANQAIRSIEYFQKLFDGEVKEPVREFLFGVKHDNK
jgi:hypothetical protein